MKVLSVKLGRQTPKGDMVKCRAMVVVEDNQGNQDDISVTNLHVNNSADIELACGEFAILKRKKQEKAKYKQAIRDKINPFTQRPRFHNYDALLKDILRDVFDTDDPQDDLLYGGSVLLPNITDARMKELFQNVSDAKILEVRTKAANVVASREALATHERVEL